MIKFEKKVLYQIREKQRFVMCIENPGSQLVGLSQFNIYFLKKHKNST